MIRALALLAAVLALGGCESTLIGGECVNSRTGEQVKVIDDTGMWREAIDSKGFRFSFRNTDKEWRCRAVAR